MGSPAFVIQYRSFVVGDRPECLWDLDIAKRTLEFLDTVDPTYFEYVADTLLPNVAGQKSQHAAMLIRASYSQALETLFAFLAATIQAPRCVAAWLTRYSLPELRAVVEAVSNRRQVISQLVAPSLSWGMISDLVHTWLVLDDKAKESTVKTGFANAWARFAHDFLDEDFSAEYNSIKHGIRAKPGGFHIAIGPQHSEGVPAREEDMRLLGKSEFGSSFLVPEKMRNSPSHLRLRRHYRNWDPEDLAWGLHIISMSMQNVISALRILNGVPATEVRFLWPTDQEVLSQPWSRVAKIGVPSMTGFDGILPEELIKVFSKNQLLEMYKNGHDGGAYSFTYPEPPKEEAPTPEGGA